MYNFNSFEISSISTITILFPPSVPRNGAKNDHEHEEGKKQNKREQLPTNHAQLFFSFFAKSAPWRTGLTRRQLAVLSSVGRMTGAIEVAVIQNCADAVILTRRTSLGFTRIDCDRIGEKEYGGNCFWYMLIV